MADIDERYGFRMKKILPPTLFMICIGLMIVLHFIIPTLQLLGFPYNLAGLGIICFGIWLSREGSNQFERAKTTVMTFDIPNVLVTDGLFRYSRNPMYLGFAIASVGIWLLLGSLTPAFIAITFIILLDRYYIRYEELIMQQTFGTQYLNYIKQVRRWI